MKERAWSVGGLLRTITPLAGLVMFLFAGATIHHTFRDFHYQELRETLAAIPQSRIAIAAALTAVSYLLLTLYDVLALRYARIPMPYRRLALVSFTGYALSNNVGYSFLSGGAIRYRMYSGWGVDTAQIGQIIAFCTVTGWLAFSVMGGAACILEPATSFPEMFPSRLHIPLGLGLLAFAVLYVTLSFMGRATLRAGRHEIGLPSGWLAVGQVVVGVLDLTAASGVFYALLAADMPLSFLSFAGIFMIAMVAGLVSQVPGGLGVFETVMITFLTAYMPSMRVLGSLILFRIIYYFVPLLLASVALGAYELFRRKGLWRRAADTLQSLSPMVPDVFAFLVFVGGAILLFSGATPPIMGRMEFVQDLLPLSMVETSHFMGSLVGVALVLVARALQRRVDAAYWAALLLLGGGALFSLLKGFDYEEAIFLVVVMVALIPARTEFHRRASLLAPQLGPGWVGAVFATLASTLWLALFAHRHVEYSSEMWWQFTFSGSAPRVLRATVGVGVIVAAFALGRLLRPAPRAVSLGDPGELQEIETLVAESGKTYAYLALLGDKHFLVDRANRGFLMYALFGRCAVAMGDPVGPPEAQRYLVWEFHEMCDRVGATEVFYQVAPENLHLYADVGLTAVKVGEEACVDLGAFTLEGASRKTERNILNKMEREGLEFSIAAREEVPELLPELKCVSDAWLRHKSTREKGFSIGWFSPEYLVHFRHALLRQEGRIVAFANVLEGGAHQELSIDLMRYSGDAPPNTMDALFLNLLLWGKNEGYEWFNFGMAPLSGIERRQASPLWNRMASLLYEHGERFYNFRGLRQYKEKYRPVWRSRYIASPGGVAFPHVLTGVTALVNRGVTGMIAR